MVRTNSAETNLDRGKTHWTSLSVVTIGSARHPVQIGKRADIFAVAEG
jgi:hypothetical protein